jgi:nonsense-mediated mRNA decay protein 3
MREAVFAVIDASASCTICPKCESTKNAGIWSDTRTDREELSQALAASAVRVHPDAENITTTIAIRHISSNRSVADVSVTGTLYGIPAKAVQKVKIVWVHEQCDRCCRISGSYYEGVIQVRANGRKPSPFELRRAAEIAYQIEDQLQTNGDRLSFVSDIEDADGGIDIVFSSQSIGSAIAHDIVGALGGSFTTHPKLVGEKAGVRLYRVTYSVRLPRFSRGDVILHEKGYFRILRQMKDTLFVQDLQTGLTRSFREDEGDPLIGNIRDAVRAPVIYEDAGILAVLDQAAGTMLEVPAYAWLSAEAGDSVLFLRDHETPVITGRDESQDCAKEESSAGDA